MACNLLEVYSKEQDTELLKDFYYQDDRRIDSANIVLSEAFNETVGYIIIDQKNILIFFFCRILLSVSRSLKLQEKRIASIVNKLLKPR